ncbi:MAG: flagellar motor switch protein FliN [Bacillota bacterium]|jgi:flagellar motor switch protein FliN/FliY|nr:flagellar motor switch protein FliN [Candidatus Fermentithermobacillaceae bacterium]
MNEQMSQDQIDALLLEASKEEAPAKPKEKPSAAEAKEDKEISAAPKTESKAAEEPVEKPEPSVQPVVFEDLSKDAETETPVAGMDALLDVPLAVSVELGRARCRVRDLLNLTVGSVVELDKSAGENVDVLVNGKLFAHGEVVVVDENFGVRITDIVSKRAIDRSARKEI